MALAVAVLSLAIAAASLLVGRGGDDAEGVRTSALQAARERAEELTTYDHRTLDANFESVLETATGDFETEYRETTDQLRSTFVESRAVAVGKAVAAGVEQADLEGGTERVVVVLAVDQVITTTGAPARTERNRIRMTLVRPDDTWLVEKVQRL